MIKSQRLGDDILRDDVVILYLIMMPPTVHTAVGGGSPAIPTSNLSIELAVNVKSRILRRSILGGTKFQNRFLFFFKSSTKNRIRNLRKRAFVTIVLVGSLGSELPALLTAITRNWYSMFSIKLTTLPWQIGSDVSNAFSHMTLSKGKSKGPSNSNVLVQLPVFVTLLDYVAGDGSTSVGIRFLP